MLEIIQCFEEAIETFRAGEEEHGYELLKFESYKKIYVDLFSGMHREVLLVLVQLPDPYFKELIENELEARRAKARLLKVRGRLQRGERQVCLV